MQYVDHFLENKNHLIDKLSLTDNQKEEIKAFFLKHPNYESKIDWNNKNLTYEDFKSLLALDGKSKTQAKDKGIEGLVEGVDYKDLGEDSCEELGKYHAYQPLTYLGSKTLASNKVPPVKENGAKWCIAYQKTSDYWDEYIKRRISFIFICTSDTKYVITFYPPAHLGATRTIEVYNFEDKRIRTPAWARELPAVKNHIGEQKTLTLEELQERVNHAIEAGVIEKNEDNTYDLLVMDQYFLRSLIYKGEFIIPFNRAKDDFDVSNFGLSSLKNCPKVVEGDFTCSNNHLRTLKYSPEIVTGSFTCRHILITSLLGGPKKVGKNYICSQNRLISLEGSPEVISGDFYCDYNKLKSLKGAPEYVAGDFYCENNNLTSLKGAPKTIEGFLDCRYNPSLSYVDVGRGYRILL